MSSSATSPSPTCSRARFAASRRSTTSARPCLRPSARSASRSSTPPAPKECRHFVMSSVLHAITTDLIQHEIKRDIEEHLLSSGLEFTILQPTNYMLPHPAATGLRTRRLRAVLVARSQTVARRRRRHRRGRRDGARRHRSHAGATYELASTRPLHRARPRRDHRRGGRQAHRGASRSTRTPSRCGRAPRRRSTGQGVPARADACHQRSLQQQRFRRQPERPDLAARSNSDHVRGVRPRAAVRRRFQHHQSTKTRSTHDTDRHSCGTHRGAHVSRPRPTADSPRAR